MRRIFRWLPLVLWLLLGAVGGAAAQEDPPSSAAAGKPPVAGPAAEAEQAIRQTASAFAAAFNRGDAAAVAACWTDDGDYVDEDGHRYQGKAEIEKAYAAFFADNPGVQMRVVVDAVRLLGPETAIEDGRASLGPFPKVPPSFSRYTAVHVKQNGQWRMASVRDSRLEPAVGPERLEDLAWLEGDWAAQQGETIVKVRFRWLPGRHFLLKTSSVHQGDQELSSTLEVIGWDPLRGQIGSWMFAADGGHAVGTWTPHSPGWFVESTGAAQDGTPTSAVNHLSQRSDDELVWQSGSRMAGNANLPDTGEVVLRRQPAGKTP